MPSLLRKCGCRILGLGLMKLLLLPAVCNRAAISESSANVLSTLVFSDLWIGIGDSFGSAEKLIKYPLRII